MKIIIGSSEVCGMIYEFGEEWKRQGNQVITISDGNRFYNYKYDIKPDNLIFSFILFKSKSISLAKIISICASRISFLKRGLSSLIIKYLLNWTDCFVQIYNAGLWDEERQLKYLHTKRKKIITLFVGSDIRDYVEFKNLYNLRHWSFTEKLNAPGSEAKLKKLRFHEKYSNAIFSVPDQSFNALRPYFHLQLPFKTEKFICNIPKRDIPVIIHAPSDPLIKGTDFIIDSLNQLKRDGLRFELRLLENIPHRDLMIELTNADILVDEIIFHGPGFLSFEAMLSGCAVATRFLESSPECFRPPVWNINEDNIQEQLKILITDKYLRINLAKAGREYALKNNNIEKVTKGILEKLYSNNYDYYLNEKK